MNPCGEATYKWDKYTLNNDKYGGVHEWAKLKQNLHFSLSNLLSLLSSLYLSCDGSNWLIANSFYFFFFILISLCFSPLSCPGFVLGLCLSIEHLAIKHMKQRDKIKKDRAKWRNYPTLFHFLD